MDKRRNTDTNDSSLTLLAISGSLRRASYNSAMINALTTLSPTGVEIDVYRSMGALPLFNPDLEDKNVAEVIAFKQRLAGADGLIIASPEYAHGITGVLKNALDWLVSGEEFVDIPVMLVNTSPRANHAQVALKEVISTMSGNIIDDAHVTVPLLGSALDAIGIVNNFEISNKILSGLRIFCDSIRSGVLTTENYH